MSVCKPMYIVSVVLLTQGTLIKKPYLLDDKDGTVRRIVKGQVYYRFHHEMENKSETEIRLCAIQIFDQQKNNPISPVVSTWFTNRRHSSFIILY